MQSTKTFILALIALVLVFSVHAAEYNEVLSQFYFTLPENAGESTKDFKLIIKRDTSIKFSFHDFESVATGYFSTHPEEKIEIKNDGILKNTGRRATFVFRISNSNKDKSGYQEVLTVLQQKDKSHKIDIMGHKNILLIPLYICMGLTAILSVVFLTVFAVLFMQKLMKKKREEKAYLLGSSMPFYPQQAAATPTMNPMYGMPAPAPQRTQQPVEQIRKM
mmetsp:Transcript_8628/g.31888  ORF Transcript_8628/g.31888 Transcript_8628/m.31888 type:complete len:220 (-) Transcript_8628:51-710(-)